VFKKIETCGLAFDQAGSACSYGYKQFDLRMSNVDLQGFEFVLEDCFFFCSTITSMEVF
jgi:hypothetical protein